MAKFMSFTQEGGDTLLLNPTFIQAVTGQPGKTGATIKMADGTTYSIPAKISALSAKLNENETVPGAAKKSR